MKIYFWKDLYISSFFYNILVLFLQGKKKKKLASEDTEKKRLPYSEEIDTLGMEEEGDATEETPKEVN